MAFTLDLSSALRVIKRKARVGSDLLPDAEATESLSDALEEYSGDSERILATDVSGTGSVFDLPATFVEGWSTIKSVESPIGSRPPIYLVEGSDYEVVHTGSGTKIQFVSVNPSLPFRVSYRALHTIDGLESETSTTVPAAHRKAVILLAVHYAALSMAMNYAGTSTPQNSGDTVNYRTKEQEWRSIAKEYRERYDKVVKENDEAAAFILDVEVPRTAGVLPRLWHMRRWT